jgi:hypothetical protein
MAIHAVRQPWRRGAVHVPGVAIVALEDFARFDEGDGTAETL